MHLIKPLEEMDEAELRAHIHRIREDRKLRKVAPKEKKKTTRSKATAKEKAMAMLDGLSEEQRAALLASLGE